MAKRPNTRRSGGGPKKINPTPRVSIPAPPPPTAPDAAADREAKIATLATLAEVIAHKGEYTPHPFLRFLADIGWIEAERAYIQSVDADDFDEHLALNVGIAVSLGDFCAYGRREAEKAPFELIDRSFSYFEQFDASTSSVTTVRGRGAEADDPGAMPVTGSPGDYYAEERTRWFDVRLCHPIVAADIERQITLGLPQTPLDMIFARFIADDVLVQKTRNQAHDASSIFAQAEATVDATYARGVHPPIIPPPWRRTGNDFIAAYWRDVQTRAGVAEMLPASEMPEAIRRFIAAVRYPVFRLLVMLDRGELVAQGINPFTNQREPIEPLFWRRENITIDFATGDIFNARTGEIEWGYVTLELPPSDAVLTQGTVNTSDYTTERIRVGRPPSTPWPAAFDRLNVEGKLNWNHPADRKIDLVRMLVETHLNLVGTPKAPIDQSLETSAKNWLYDNYRPLMDRAVPDEPED